MIIDNNILENYKKKEAPFGFNGLGYITYKRTYARTVEGTNRTEEWYETVARVVNWLHDQHILMNIEQPSAFYLDLYDAVFNLKASFSGRMLWQAGTKTVDRLGGASMCNCWGMVADCKQSFLNSFDLLMLGGGVGFNIQEKHVGRLPKIKGPLKIVRQDNASADFIIPDTREGWVSLLDRVLTAFFETNEGFTYSTQLIRPYGKPIAGFGGTASGPEPLVDGITQIVDLLNSRTHQKLKPIDVLDIMNIIASIVVAGNVRRSAQIAVGDIHDDEFLEAKKWSNGIPNHRAMSNNTVVCNAFDKIPEKFWEGYLGDGEPYGLFNMDLVQAKGRIADDHRNDPGAIITNPCGEISLAPNEGDGSAESCNLAEIFLNNIKDAKEFKKIANLMYIVTKTVSMLPYHIKETNEIVHTNYRLGIGLTGILQRPDLTTADVLTDVYRSLEDNDFAFFEEYGIGTSIKLTTVKPSGTLSLLAGATPGVHPAYAQHYIRRIRMSADDSLVQRCKDAGYFVEYAKGFDGTDDRKTVIVEFPIALEKGVPIANEFTAIDQLEVVKHIQRYWADNQVSVTVYYKKEELDEIRAWLSENYDDNIKAVSFLLHNDHGFHQAPYEEISEEKYNELMSGIEGIEFGDVEEATFEESVECEGGACPVR